MSRILDRARDAAWEHIALYGHGSNTPRDKFVWRVAHAKGYVEDAGYAAAGRLWKDLARGSGDGGRNGVFVDRGMTDPAPKAIDQGAALRRASVAMGFVLKHLRTDLQRRIFARVFDTAPVTRMDYTTALRDCHCDRHTFHKGLVRSSDLLAIHYGVIDKKGLDGGSEYHQTNL